MKLYPQNPTTFTYQVSRNSRKESKSMKWENKVEEKRKKKKKVKSSQNSQKDFSIR